MKIKLLPLVAGIATLSIAAAPFILNAQKSNAFPPDGPPGLSQLNLTPDQQAKFEQLRNNAESQIEAILSPAQVPHFQNLKTIRQQLRQETEALNLTADQKKQMHSIMEANRKEMDGILTDAQKAQLRQERQSHMGEHGGGRRNQAPQ